MTSAELWLGFFGTGVPLSRPEYVFQGPGPSATLWLPWPNSIPS